VQASQPTLTITSVKGTFGKPLTLTTGGGAGTGVVTFALGTGGTAQGCTLSGTTLTVTKWGTCVVTATKAADVNYLVASSAATNVVFPAPYRLVKVHGVARTGRTVNVAITGTGFYGRPTITSNGAGTTALVIKDHGNWMLVRVTVQAGTRRGVHTFTVTLRNGLSHRINYIQR
jgi:hypothetical protein